MQFVQTIRQGANLRKCTNIAEHCYIIIAHKIADFRVSNFRIFQDTINQVMLKIICSQQGNSIFETVLNIETVYNLNILKNISFCGGHNSFQLYHGYTRNSFNREATKSQAPLLPESARKYCFALVFIRTRSNVVKINPQWPSLVLIFQFWVNWTINK